MTVVARAEVLNTAPGVHGGRHALLDETESILDDFSVSLNAFGPSADVLRAVRGAAIDEYPDPTSHAARVAAASAWNVPLNTVVFGAGAAELIHAVCFAYLRVGDGVLIDAPAFGEYERAARLCGARVQSTTKTGLYPSSSAAFIASIDSHRPRLVFTCSPSNPTGVLRPSSELAEISDACLRVGALLVLDQAFDAFSDEPSGTPALRGHAAVLHVRSLTKEHALAGVRVAYAAGPAPVIAAVEAARVSWAASTVAQAAAAATFTSGSVSHARESIARLRSESVRLRDECAAAGLSTIASSTHFFLIQVACARGARALLLRESRILVRDCSSFGLPQHIRVAARTPSANDRLIAALSRLSPRLRS